MCFCCLFYCIFAVGFNFCHLELLNSDTGILVDSDVVKSC